MRDGKPVLLDLFSGAGGAAKGYQRAGFYVVGVDHKPQPRYAGDEFIQADAMTYPLEGFDAIHASPPCQAYSIMNNLPWVGDGRERPTLILPTLERLEAHGKPYVLENVYGARHGAKGLTKSGLEAHGLKAGWLCGTMFGLELYRHRLFASSFFWLAPAHPRHTLNLHPRSERAVYGGTVKGLPGGSAGLNTKPSRIVNTAWRTSHDGVVPVTQRTPGLGHSNGWHKAAEMMGIDWMKREELTQAIPPVMTEYIGQHLRMEIDRCR